MEEEYITDAPRRQKGANLITCQICRVEKRAFDGSTTFCKQCVVRGQACVYD